LNGDRCHGTVALGCLSCFHRIDTGARKHALAGVRRCACMALRNAKLSDEDVAATMSYASELFGAAEKAVPRKAASGKKMAKAKGRERLKAA
jgi:hypothetical protein